MRLFIELPWRTLLACSLLLACGRLADAQVNLKFSGDHVAVTIGGAPFTDFYTGAAYPKPFLSPLRSASGLIVTRAFPMQTIPGESHDHPHHRGLFIGYGEINGINFWANETSNSGENKGRIVIRNIEKLKGGNKSGTVRALFEWHDPGGANLMNEDRTMIFYDEKGIRTIDFDITFTAKINLQWADTKEGFFAIRLADSMNEEHGGKMTSAEGAQGEKNVWGKQARWVDYSGQVNGQTVGVAIFPAPSDPRYPPRWHSRAYGLFAVNPWGLKEFIEDPHAEGGGLTMAAGQSMRLRYRVIIHGSDVTPLNLPDLYSRYLKDLK
jgi:hypothetical protein